MTNYIDVPETQCAFCDYLAGRRPYTFLDRTQVSAILVTREQRGIAHCLVVPLLHRPTILDLTETEQIDIMRNIRRVAEAINIQEMRPGLSIWQNNGRPASQTIPHVHFHVAATLDSGGTDWGHVPELTLAETEAIAAHLRPALPR